MGVILAEMQFGAEGQHEELHVRTFHDGTIEILAANGGSYEGCPLTLGQAIQLRDFLNRHIDELALKQTGSLAERSIDDPAQLAAVEEVMNQAPTWNEDKTQVPFSPDRYKKD